MAYRAEDISKRLVPHELYIREELEESVQFDVRPVFLLVVSCSIQKYNSHLLAHVTMWVLVLDIIACVCIETAALTP